MCVSQEKETRERKRFSKEKEKDFFLRGVRITIDSDRSVSKSSLKESRVKHAGIQNLIHCETIGSFGDFDSDSSLVTIRPKNGWVLSKRSRGSRRRKEVFIFSK